MVRTGIVVDGSYSMQSRLIHGPATSRGWSYDFGAHPPVVRSNTYRLGSAERGHEAFCKFADPNVDLQGQVPMWIYERLNSPSKTMLQERYAQAHNGTAARVLATGMAAINVGLFSVLDSRLNHRLLSDSMLYGCTHSDFQRGFLRKGIAVDTVDTSNLAAVTAAIKDDTRVIYFETPANPSLRMTDITALRALVEQVNNGRPEEKKIVIVVDNTFATAYSQRPLDLGADIVAESLTKNVNGFGTRMGGIVIVRDALRFLPDIDMELKDGGAVMLDEVAWDYIVYSLPTLIMRSREKYENAGAVATFLEGHPKIGMGNVLYPGLDSFPQAELARRQLATGIAGKFAAGEMICFQLAKREGEDRPAYLQRTADFLNYIADQAYDISLAVSLGLLKTVIECPALMTHSSYSEDALIRAGILPGAIRLSVGTEAPADIIADLGEALEKAA